MNLCSAFDRYQNAIRTLKKKGLDNPQRISGLMAPRFINFPYWKQSEKVHNYNPWFVYTPAPESWKKWEEGAFIVDDSAAQNLRNGQVRIFDLVWLQKLHATTLEGLLAEKQKGTFRVGEEFGTAFVRRTSLTELQLQGLEKLGYLYKQNSGKALISWNPTVCLEDKSTEKQKLYNPKSRIINLEDWPEINRDQFFLGANGTKRQCGYIKYTPYDQLNEQLGLWYQYVKSTIQEINSQEQIIDPVYFAAKTQQWFIVIHPFVGGNGRMSRFLMDYILQSLGLPSAVLQDMDNDIYKSTEDWAKEVGNGIEYAVKYAEYCAYTEGATVGCNEITREPVKELEGK